VRVLRKKNRIRGNKTRKSEGVPFYLKSAKRGPGKKNENIIGVKKTDSEFRTGGVSEGATES